MFFILIKKKKKNNLEGKKLRAQFVMLLESNGFSLSIIVAVGLDTLDWALSSVFSVDLTPNH